MVPKKEFEREIIPRLNAQYKSEGCLSRFTVASYGASAVVSDINKKLRDIGFSISESVGARTRKESCIDERFHLVHGLALQGVSFTRSSSQLVTCACYAIWWKQ